MKICIDYFFCYKTKKIRLTVNHCETVVLGQCFGNFGWIKLLDRHWAYIITDHRPMSHQPVGACCADEQNCIGPMLFFTLGPHK